MNAKLFVACLLASFASASSIVPIAATTMQFQIALKQANASPRCSGTERALPQGRLAMGPGLQIRIPELKDPNSCFDLYNQFTLTTTQTNAPSLAASGTLTYRGRPVSVTLFAQSAKQTIKVLTIDQSDMVRVLPIPKDAVPMPPPRFELVQTGVRGNPRMLRWVGTQECVFAGAEHGMIQLVPCRTVITSRTRILVQGKGISPPVLVPEPSLIPILGNDKSRDQTNPQLQA